MFRRFILWLSHLWAQLCEFTHTPSTPAPSAMATTTNPQTQPTFVSTSTTTQTPSTSAPNAMASTTGSQTQLTLVSGSTPTKYDVFLSFRGEDTRRSFTSHLYHELHSNGFRTFMDEPELARGEVISDALLDAIRNSKAYIVVFSENYATSPWCLDELAEILSCHRTMQRWVIPVFFNIDPSVVRHQTGSFQKAFEKHKKRFRGERQKVDNWRFTLKEVADLSGHHLSDSNDRYETDVISEIVEELLLKINPNAMASTTGSQTQLTGVSGSTPTQYDVFFSFHSKDTRLNFTGHLNQRLDDNRIRTFKDNPELRRGEVISDALLYFIRNCKTYIVVFSENYADSPWCLDELAEILNCHRTMQRWVIPVFFNIDPSVVRHQNGSFRKAFNKHQKRFGGEREKLENWQRTLKEVAGFSGHHVSKDRSEADVINEIVDELLLKINPKTLKVAQYPVGLDSHVEAITTLLTKGVIKFGIYGMGGVGKTTLAKALFNQLVRGGSFEGSCFLPNVREASGRFKGVESLQQQLINDVLRCRPKVHEVQNVDQGIELIEARICSSKVVVVIDDLDDPKHFQLLVGPFASGSVVIITTRDEEILDKIEVENRYRYMVNALDEADSRELFMQYAFGNAVPSDIFMELSEDIIRLAAGLPLALKIFGSHLCRKTEVRWKYYIEKLQQIPNLHQYICNGYM